MRKRFAIIMITVLILAIANGFATAAEYPSKPIIMINPTSPGGSTDVLGRLFAEVAKKYLGQPIVVVNKPIGIWGGNVVGRDAKPDGYTLTLMASGLIPFIEWERINGRKPPVTTDEFLYLGAMSKSPILVITPYNRPWKTLGELLEYAKTNTLTYCSGGLYGSSHVPIEMVLRAAGIDIAKTRHVPYIGGGPCLQALTGGHYDMATQFPSTSIPMAEGKIIRILAVLSDKRLESLPDVPTCRELGIDAIYWQAQAVAAPLKTPAPIMEKLRKVFKQTVEDPQYIKMVESLGDKVIPTFGDETVKDWGEITRRCRALFSQILKEQKEKEKK